MSSREEPLGSILAVKRIKNQLSKIDHVIGTLKFMVAVKKISFHRQSVVGGSQKLPTIENQLRNFFGSQSVPLTMRDEENKPPVRPLACINGEEIAASTSFCGSISNLVGR
jgi:hypothetical protein